MAKHDQLQDVKEEVMDALNFWIVNCADENNFLFEALVHPAGRNQILVWFGDNEELKIALEIEEQK